jgi:hypothetical protein
MWNLVFLERNIQIERKKQKELETDRQTKREIETEG